MGCRSLGGFNLAMTFTGVGAAQFSKRNWDSSCPRRGKRKSLITRLKFDILAWLVPCLVFSVTIHNVRRLSHDSWCFSLNYWGKDRAVRKNNSTFFQFSQIERRFSSQMSHDRGVMLSDFQTLFWIEVSTKHRLKSFLTKGSEKEKQILLPRDK